MRIAPAILIILATAGCTGEPPVENAPERRTAQSLESTPAPTSNVDASDAYPAAVPPSWDVASLPPAELLTRAGGCPFECCQYGEWWSDSATVVYRAPRDTTAVAFTLPPRTPVLADTGVVFVTSLARVVLDAPMSEEQIGVRGVGTLTSADTLYLVEPVGEGAFVVWLRGRELELPGFWESYYPGTTARREGEYAREWWARVRTRDGRSGWVWMDRTRAPMWGADACGGPPPREPGSGK